MSHQLVMDTDEFVKSLKDASLYVSKEDISSPASCVMLNLNKKQKSVSVVACDRLGYYEGSISLTLEKGSKPSLPGKPMRLFIPGKEIPSIVKAAKCKGPMKLEIQDAKGNNYPVRLSLPNFATCEFNAPVFIEIPDYAGIRKLAEKGKKTTINLGQLMFPIKELIRAAKVFPVQIGSTIPMYIAKWKNGGLITMLEYQSEYEHVDIKVIFAIGTGETA